MSTLNTSHYFNLMRILKNRITPTGTVLAFAGANSPQGWLSCDGSTLLITDYPCLYDVIGTTFNRGVVDPSYFMIPDLRGRTLIGASHTGTDISSAGTNITQRDIGDISGSETHILTIPQMPSHNHGGLTGVSGEHDHGGSTGSGGWSASSIAIHNVTTQTNAADDDGSHSHSISSDGSHAHVINSQGGDQPHNNMQPYLVINYIIKY